MISLCRTLLKVKCHYAFRQNAIDEAVETKKFFVKKTKENTYELKLNHVYWHNVQGQLCITKKRNMLFGCVDPETSFDIVN